MSAGRPKLIACPMARGRLRSSRGRNDFPPGMKTPRTAHPGFAGGATSAKQRSGVACDGCRASMLPHSSVRAIAR